MAKTKIGYYGHPPRETIIEHQQRFPELDWVDLDVDLGNPDSQILPKNTCRIIRNIIDNAIALKDELELIISSVGAEKCDGGRHVAYLLEKLGFKVEEFRNEKIMSSLSPESINVPISSSDLPLRKKIEKIMDTVISDSNTNYQQIKPKYGFWGVPPHDFDLLDLFPNTTHVYGWTRCVEAGRPSDMDLETFVEFGVPTVFYVQTFCAKAQLAKYLSEKHGGLFIDADGKIGMGVKARIEAFLELNVK